ncbi:dynein heavy chain, partial [Kipferlia bialata]
DSGAYVIRGVDEVLQLLDDHIVVTQAMRGSPYIKPFANRVIEWENRLNGIQDVIDRWLACQRLWVYLEPIFSSADIQVQMPTDYKNFSDVDTFWHSASKETLQSPSVMTVTLKANLLEDLTEACDKLEVINKNLAQYLGTKRMAFPRFFFLSNDELLEILSQ